MTAYIVIIFVIDAVILTVSDEFHMIEAEIKSVVSVFSLAYLTFFIGMVIQTVIVTASDPSDPTVALERLHKHTMKEVEEGKRKDVVPFNEYDFEFYC